MLKKAALTGLGLLFSIAAVASEEVLPDELPIQWASIITLSGGVGWATAGQNQYLYPFPLPSYQYFTYNSDTSTMGSGEVFFGLQKPLPVYPNILGELGLGIAYMTDATVTGYANVDGTLNAYAYTYKVNHGRLELKGRLIGYTIQPVQPYISGSLGVAFNNAHAYRPTLLIPSVSYPLQFVSNSTVAFPYTLGAGIQAKLDPHWLVAAGYQFADLGKSFLNGDGTYLSKGLRLTHFYTNEALLSISYTFS